MRRLTLSTYGHVIDELEDLPRVDAETAVNEARATLAGGQNERRSQVPRGAHRDSQAEPTEGAYRVHEVASQIAPSRLATGGNRLYAGAFTTGRDWRLLTYFSDKEEVPGSSPGSPTRIFLQTAAL